MAESLPFVIVVPLVVVVVVIVDAGVASLPAPAEAFAPGFGWNIVPNGLGFEP